MNPENLSAKTLQMFNRMSDEARRETVLLTATHSEDEAVCLAAMRHMTERERRKLLFRLSRERWGL